MKSEIVVVSNKNGHFYGGTQAGILCSSASFQSQVFGVAVLLGVHSNNTTQGLSRRWLQSFKFFYLERPVTILLVLTHLKYVPALQTLCLVVLLALKYVCCEALFFIISSGPSC